MRDRLIVLFILLFVILGLVALFLYSLERGTIVDENNRPETTTPNMATATQSFSTGTPAPAEVNTPPTVTPRPDPPASTPAPNETGSANSAGETGAPPPAGAPVEFLGVVNFPVSFAFEETIVGGLSALAYHPEKDVFYVLSDDRGQVDNARFYTITLNLENGVLDQGDITFSGVGFLKDEAGQPYAEESLDPEGMTLSDRGTLYISSEGDADELIAPFVHEVALNGQFLAALPVPEKFLPTENGDFGIRDNLALESLTLSPDNQFLFTAVENALHQDGPQADLETRSLARILQYDLAAARPVHEYVYVVEPVPESPLPAGEISNGLVELIALDNAGTFLALERAFSAGVGNTIILYSVQIADADDVAAVESLFSGDFEASLAAVRPVQKQFLFDVGTVMNGIDNVEGMALGPLLPDGRQTLLLVSDNNFNPAQQTQFILLALNELE